MKPDPYEALAELAEQELELARAGDLERLEEIQARRAEIVARLPARPPRDAGEALERAAQAQRGASELLSARMGEIARELGRVDVGRRAARSYGGATTPAGSFDHAA